MTDWDRLARPALRGLVRYDPGPSRDSLRAEHGLDALEPLNWNEDRFGPPDGVLEAAAAEVRNAALYPERAYADFRDAVAEWLDVPPTHVIPGHGAQSLLASLTTAFLGVGTTAAVPGLTYGFYLKASSAAGAEVVTAPRTGLEIDLEALAATARAARARVVWLCDPNNPTGFLVDPAAWAAFLDELPPDCIVVADEAYMDFADPALRCDRRADVLAGRPVIVVRSFSKIFGLAGLRLGYALADPQVARLLDVVQEPFNVNRVALVAGRVAVGHRGFVARRRAEVAAARDVLGGELERAGLGVFPSQANFVLMELGTDDREVCTALLQRGLLIRGGSDFGLPGYARVTAAPEPIMRRAAADIVAVTQPLRMP
ncbi:MAG: pyridoxal phosphate-dependent aminotransferase [Gaiellales bacterium]